MLLQKIGEYRKELLSCSKRFRQVILGQTRPRKLGFLQNVLIRILSTQLKSCLQLRPDLFGQPFLFSTDELIIPVLLAR